MFDHLSKAGQAELAAIVEAHEALSKIYQDDREAGEGGRWLLDTLARRMFDLMKDPVTGAIILTPEWIEENAEPVEPIVGEPSTWEDPLDDPWGG